MIINQDWTVCWYHYEPQFEFEQDGDELEHSGYKSSNPPGLGMLGRGQLWEAGGMGVNPRRKMISKYFMAEVFARLGRLVGSLIRVVLVFSSSA